MKVYNTTRRLTSKILLRYDNDGNLTEESFFGVNEEALEKKLYGYDESRNLKQEARYRLDKLVQTTTYYYNAACDLQEIYVQHPGADKFLKQGFVYAANGRLSKIRWRRNDREEFNLMGYNYDQKGICSSVDTYYPATDYRVLTRYIYAYY